MARRGGSVEEKPAPVWGNIPRALSLSYRIAPGVQLLPGPLALTAQGGRVALDEPARRGSARGRRV